MTRVGLNALFLHHPHSGTGRYLERLITEMPGDIALDLLAARALPPLEPRWSEVSRLNTPFDSRPALAKIWYEQVSAPEAARRRANGVLHVPYFAPPLRSPVPVVVTVHDLVPVLRPEYRQTAAQRLYTLLVCRGLRAARRIITDSDASRRDLERVLHISPSVVRVIPLAVDARFRPVAPREQDAMSGLRSRLSVPGPYVHYLGGLDRRKNVQGLIAAFARLKRERQVPHHLVIVGATRTDNPLFYDPRPDVERLGLTDCVRMIDRVSDEEARALHAGSDAFVFPSLYEGFGLPPLEALACGAPVVCSHASSLPEVIGDAAVLVDAKDEAALAAALGRVLSDSELRRDLRARGPAQAARFTWTETAGATARVYREAAGAAG